MLIKKTVDQFARWLGPDRHRSPDARDKRLSTERRSRHRRLRAHILEALEPRCLMAADVIQIGAVYIEEDLGSDIHGDSFYVTFEGGAPDTQLKRLTIDGDLNTPGFGLGDLFLDTVESGLGADHAFDFKIERLETANSGATVTATVVDGTSLLVLDFTNFVAGDMLVFSIDVDEVQSYDPNETDLSVQNDNFDPITSGVEFQNSKLTAEFIAPHYEDVSGQDKFLNRYDPWLNSTTLPLPADDADGKRDRTAGGGIELQQIPKPISLAGVVYQDKDEDLQLDTTDSRLSGVTLELFRQQGNGYVSTGHTTVTDSQGAYRFGTELGLQPGTYQVREVQPAGYYSVGATPGLLDGLPIGEPVSGNPDILTEVDLLLGDQHATELNFAENLPSSISGHVCVVTGGSDCFTDSATKAPLEGVLIELRDASGQVVETTRTDATGFYRFENLRSGTYSVTEVTPAGLLEGAARVGSVGGLLGGGSYISQITIGGGISANGYDFCELTPSELSGHTFYDQNNNGRRDDGETPLSGVLVTLWDEAGNKVDDARTDSQGYYRFDGLRPGRYTVTEVTPAGYIPGQADVGSINGTPVGTNDSTGDKISAIILPAGAEGINYDFGEILPGSIAGQVIADTNGNCVIDAAGDRPLPGVRIELLSPSGSVLQTTLTDANGNYLFENLLPGTYSVREIQPAGYFHGDQSAGSGGGDDSVDDVIRAISLTPGQALVDYDFCDIPPGSIAGSVFVDSDQDCFFDSGEAPISGVTITLFDDSGTVVATTTTDANGNYRFDGLRPGSYTVRESQPAGYLQGGQRAGSGGGNDSAQDVISAVDLTAGTALVDYDFCELSPGSIAGSVYVDSDQDCYFDSGEAPIEGVTITLLNESGSVVATTTTDSRGSYQFNGLRPGNYTVRESQPEGYFQGGQRAGSGGGNDSVQDVISAVSLAVGTNLVDYDFCELEPGSISGLVFADLDNDCFRDADESGLADVRVDLLDAAGTVIETTRTAADGTYQFSNLRPGSYTVREYQPDGYFHRGQVAPGSPDAPNGDASSADVIRNILVGSGSDVTDANFCEVPPAELNGYVFQDGPVIQNATGTVPEDLTTIRDGQRTSDDTPIAGTKLQLRLVTGAQAPADRVALPGYYDGEFIEVTTDENGFYSFKGLKPGAFYTVFQVQPPAYVDGLDTPGSTGGLSLNSSSEIDAYFDAFPSSGLRQFSDAQLMDAVIGVPLAPGQISTENNFSEVLAEPVLPPPPPPPPPPSIQRPVVSPELFEGLAPLTATPPLWSPLPLLVGFGNSAPLTWHLSVINGGQPRGARSGEVIDDAMVERASKRLNPYSWAVAGMHGETMDVVSTEAAQTAPVRKVFDLPGAIPLAADFNGDGEDEIALFVDGEWFIDSNGNGEWDELDIWLRLGDKDDQPVVGDWDNDGKADVGVFGRRWSGDQRALAAEAGLPDPENRETGRFKNVPPSRDEAPDDPRLIKRSRHAEARAHLIDHVFRFGGGKDVAISGDFNGSGVDSVGVFRDGKWILDVNGDGKLNHLDESRHFGEKGDLPLVGNFIGESDSADELAVIRGNQVIVDSNGNGEIDATDQVFLLESDGGTVIAADFDGDGMDEPILHQTVEQQRILTARRAG